MREIVHKTVGTDANGEILAYSEFFGDSTETKPVKGVGFGSSFTEVDTGDVYMFQEGASAGSEWVKEFSLQG